MGNNEDITKLLVQIANSLEETSKLRAITSDDMILYAQILSTILGLSQPIAGAILYIASTIVSAGKDDIDKLSGKLLQENPPDEKTQAIMNLTSEVRTAAEKMQEAENESNEAKDNWQSIQTMVNTEDGSIINPELQGKLQNLIDTLNDYISETAKIEVKDNKIQDYKYFSDNMEKIIERTRIENQKESLSEITYKAYDNIDSIREQYNAAQEKESNTYKDYKDKLNLLVTAQNNVWYDYGTHTADEFESWARDARDNWLNTYKDLTPLSVQKIAYENVIEWYESLLNEEKKYEVEPLEKWKSTADTYGTPDTTGENPATIDEFMNTMGNIKDFFNISYATGDIAAIVQTAIAASTPAAAYASQAENSSPESQSGCCCKINVAEILEGLNKPIKIMLNETELGEAVLTYARNNSQMTGN